MKTHNIFLQGCSPAGAHAIPKVEYGMTLLELLIAMTLGLLLLVGIGTIFVGSTQTYRVQEENARIQEAGRFALEVIGRSLRQAGYLNVDFNNPVSTVTTFSGTAIHGTPNTLTLAYDGTGAADCAGTVIAVGAVAQEAYDLTAGALRCNNQPLIANVQELRFLYGLDTDSNQSVNQYTAMPSAADLPNIVSARVCVVIRSENQGIAIGNQTYLNCDGALATGAAARTVAADTRLYRAFVGTFNLRNRVNILP